MRKREEREEKCRRRKRQSFLLAAAISRGAAGHRDGRLSLFTPHRTALMCLFLRLKPKLTQMHVPYLFRFPKQKQKHFSGSGSDRPPGRRLVGRRRCRLIFRACRGGHCHRRQGRLRQGPIQPRLCAQSEFIERALPARCRRTGAAQKINERIAPQGEAAAGDHNDQKKTLTLFNLLFFPPPPSLSLSLSLLLFPKKKNSSAASSTQSAAAPTRRP